jgi:hypothetical protein
MIVKNFNISESVMLDEDEENILTSENGFLYLNTQYIEE